jgi:type II secretory pathway component PulF
MKKSKKINFKNLLDINYIKNRLSLTWLKISKGTGSSRLSIKDQTFFIKRLSFLIKAGIPVTESLHMIREQTSAKRYSKILDTIIEDVSNGQFLSSSLSKFKGMFGEFAINIVHVGETSGILSQNLEYLADELKKKQMLRQKVIGAFIYPAVVTLATLGITSFLMIYLFPKITPVFSSLHMTLPISTRIVIFISNSLINYGWYIISVIIILTAAFWIILKKSKIFHYYFDKYVLKIPILGRIMQGYNLANATRTMGLLLKSSITISEALPIVSKTTSNLVYKKEFQSMVLVVNKGERISAYLKKKGNLFPEVLSQIIAVGERSGNLSNSFIYLSELYEGEVDDFTKNLSSMIEPVLMVFMGILVGFIAISIITPIYSITQNLHG